MFAYVFAEALQRRDKALAQRIRESYVPYLESVIAFFVKRSAEVIGREFPQVMLLHANDLNALALPEILVPFGVVNLVHPDGVELPEYPVLQSKRDHMLDCVKDLFP